MDDTEKQVLEFVKSNLLTAEARLYEHIHATFRWLMATLFAANGGALIGIFGSGHHDYERGLLVWFAAGVTFAILMGILSGLSGHRWHVRFNNLRLKIEQSLIEKRLDPSIANDLQDQKVSWKSWFPSYAGVASFICLIGGMIHLGFRL